MNMNSCKANNISDVHQPNFLANSWRRVREDEETNLGFKETSNF